MIPDAAVVGVGFVVQHPSQVAGTAQEGIPLPDPDALELLGREVTLARLATAPLAAPGA